jgi:hypothetical protein
MTGEQSRSLQVGAQVCWQKDQADHGKIIGIAWSGVTISWQDGHTSSVRHNDMGDVTMVPIMTK